MPSIDERVVALKFDSSRFQAGVQTAISMLDRLKSAMNIGGKAKGLDDIQKQADSFSVSHVESEANKIGLGFVAASAVAIGALTNIATQAISTGASIAKSLTLEPVMDGFREYELNMGSIQTILANTQSKGSTLQDVNGALDQLNTYADKTIYNFAQMTKNIGTFTAAGVDLDTSVSAIKGISNLAAVSGSDANQASTAMYQLSQALAAGKVGLQDWNSVVNAGMGGQVFQEALFETAKAMGRIEGISKDTTFEQWTKSGKSFRDSLQDGWINAEVLTNTLKGFTGDMSDAQLKQIGYTDEQIKKIKEFAVTANEAATKVKTFTQLKDTIKEGIGSGWAKTWQLVLGDFEQSGKLFSGIYNAIDPLIQKTNDARNNLLDGFLNKLHGRDRIVATLGLAFENVGRIFKTVGEAAGQVFKPITPEHLLKATQAFQRFVVALTPGEKTLNNLRRTMAGVFSVFSIAGQIIGPVVSMFAKLIGITASGGSGILAFTGYIGSLITRFDQFLQKSQVIPKFFEGLGNVLAAPIEGLKAFGGALVRMADIKVPGLNGIAERIAAFNRAISESSALEAFKNRLQQAASVIGSAGSLISAQLDKLSSVMGKFKEHLTEAFSGASFDGLLDFLNVGLAGGIGLLLNKIVKDGLNIDATGGLLKSLAEALTGKDGLIGSIKDTFGALEGTLSSLQANVQADTLQKIAIAVGILAASIVALSLIDSGKMSASLAGIGAAIGELVGALFLLTKLQGLGTFTTIPVLAGAMIALAIAIDLLAIAVLKMGQADLETLAKGLGSVAISLGILIGGLKSMQGLAGGGMISSAIAMGVMAAALIVMATAVEKFGNIEMGELAKGLTAAAIGLGVMAGAMKAMPADTSLSAVGILALAGALIVMSIAVERLGNIEMGELAKGLTSVAIVLGLLTAATRLMNPSQLISTGVGLTLVAGALTIVAGVIEKLGNIEMGELVKGIAGMAAALVVMGVAMVAMQGALGGAASLTIAAAGILMLSQAVKVMGEMSWEEIGKSMLVLAGAIVVIAGASALLTPVIPSMLGLGVALLAVGAGLALAGGAALAFASAWAIFSAAGDSGIATVERLGGLVPGLLTNLAAGIVNFVTELANRGSELVDSLTKLGETILEVFIRLLPKLAEVIGKLVDAILKVLVDNIPKIAEGAIQLVLGMIEAIGRQAERISNAATQLIIAFLNALSNNLPKVAQAGVDMVINLVNAIANGIRSNIPRMRAAGLNLATAIIDGMTGGLLSGASRVISAAASMAGQALAAAKNKLGIHSPSREFKMVGGHVVDGFVQGLKENEGKVISATENTFQKSLSEALKGTADVLKESQNAVESFNKVVEMILKQQEEMEKAQEKAEQAQEKLLAAEEKVQEAEEKAAEAWEKAEEAKEKARKAEAEAAKAGKDAAKKKEQAAKAWKDAEKAEKNAIKTQKGIAKAQKELAKAQKEAGQATEAAAKSQVGFAADVARAAGGISGPSPQQTTGWIDHVENKVQNNLKPAMVEAQDIFRQGQVNIANSANEIGSITQRMWGSFLRGDMQGVRQGFVDIQGVINRTLDDIRDRVFKLGETARRAAEELRDGLHKRFEDLISSGRRAIDEALRPMNETLSQLRENYGSFDKIKTKVGEFFAQEFKAAEVQTNAFKQRLGGLRQEIEQFVNRSVGDLQKGVGNVRKEFEGAAQSAQTFANNLVRDLRGGLASTQAYFTQELPNQARSWFNSGVNFGQNLVAGMQQGMASFQTDTVKYVENSRRGVERAVSDLWMDAGRQANQAYADGMRVYAYLSSLTVDDVIKMANDAITNGINETVNFFTVELPKKAEELIQNGQQMAQNIVDGLTNGIQNAQGQVDSAISAMALNALNVANSVLGIHSPSREFAKIGKFTAEGMALGIDQNSDEVISSTKAMATGSIDAMRQSILQMSKVLDQEIDLQPVISPVMDLSQVQAGARAISSAIGTNVVSPNVSYGQAVGVSRITDQTAQAVAEAEAPAGVNINFTQNNTSPEALSAIDIYRNTRNQLSMVKEALKI